MKKIAIGLGAAACMSLLCPLESNLSQAHEADTSFRLLTFSGRYVKWGTPALGTGATVSFAFVTEAMQFDDARNCARLVPMDGLLSDAGISRRQLEEEAYAAFRIWEDAADITFVAAAEPADADILIGAQGEPVGRAYADVSYRVGSGTGVKVIDRSLICLNPEQPWKVGFDGDMEVYDLRYTLIHEIGHAIGLDHPNPAGQVMSFRYHENFRDLQAGDLEGVTALYGDGAYRFLAELPEEGAEDDSDAVTVREAALQ